MATQYKYPEVTSKKVVEDTHKKELSLEEKQAANQVALRLGKPIPFPIVVPVDVLGEIAKVLKDSGADSNSQIIGMAKIVRILGY